jgi:hypothetical protein
MSVLEQLFPRRWKPVRCAILVGDGQFNLYVASTAQQRIQLERLYGCRTDEPYRLPALLIPRPINARGLYAVAVLIRDETVGYLHHTTALGFLAALRAGVFDRAACGAMIVMRPDPQRGDQALRLRLDAEVPFMLVDPANLTASDQEEANHRQRDLHTRRVQRSAASPHSIRAI